MSKELMEDLLIEFDEMGFEPTTLCDNQKEIDSFRNRLKQVLDYLKAIDNAKPSEALECLKEMWELSCDSRKPEYILYDSIRQALLKAQEQEKVLEIIKEKEVDTRALEDSDSVEMYNEVSLRPHLTEEEFNIIKEVVE